jgi:hypothetical protein
MAANVVAREVSIVMVGNFNPAILHPLWFSSQKLIKRAEAEAAEIELVHREMALWHTEWFKLNVVPERLQLRCEQEAYFEPARDLALGVLMLLEHTPVRAL